MAHAPAESATGITTTVRDFVSMAFQEAGIELAWEGKDVKERGTDTKTGGVLVQVDPRYFRPAEVDILIGDPSKAKEKLGWEPEVSLPELVKMMVATDLDMARRDVHLKNGGFEVKNCHE